MNTKRIACQSILLLALGLLLGAGAGCKSKPHKSTQPVAETQAPAIKAARPAADSKEKQLQEQINLMQEQVGPLTARTEALARFHGGRMSPKWVEKVRDAREDASNLSERLRYLEATKTLLARKLNALRAELKVYEEFEQSNPAVPRP